MNLLSLWSDFTENWTWFELLWEIFFFVVFLSLGVVSFNYLYLHKKYKMPHNVHAGEGITLRFKLAEHFRILKKQRKEHGPKLPFIYMNEEEFDYNWVENLLEASKIAGYSIVLRRESEGDILTEEEKAYLSEAYSYQFKNRK